MGRNIIKVTEFIDACKCGNLDLAKQLYETGKYDVHVNNEYAFRCSCKKGKLDVAK